MRVYIHISMISIMKPCVIYTARLGDAVYVLHVFQKKTQATSKRGTDLAKSRYVELLRG
ncbi:protein containing DUF891, partial [mine drainage metagenome]